MSSYSASLIAPFKTGLSTDFEGWISPPDSFSIMENVHIRHGYISRRNGYSPLGTLGTDDPVMGLYQYIDSDNVKSLLAFNTVRAYLYNTGTLVFDDLTGTDIFNGSDTDFIWADNFQASRDTNVNNVLYFTNGLSWDGTYNGIKTYDGSSVSSIQPDLGGGQKLYGCKLLFAFRNRLITLNTFEGSNPGAPTNYPQRMRWCQSQNPNPASYPTGGWDDTKNGKGSYADAATGDQIISARQLKDSIIVFFTDSVWKIVYTSNPAEPFVWKKINNFRATQGRMATAGFDSYVTALGGRGITATDQNQTKRIDNKITDFSNDVIDANNINRTFMFRDYQNTRWWTLYTGKDASQNNGALIYDDDSGAFSTYEISLTCLGYGTNAIDWALSDFTGDYDFALDDMGEETLESYFQSTEEQLVAGTVDGNVLVLDNSADDNGTEISSTLETAYWSPYKDQGLEAQFGYIDLFVDTDFTTVLNIEFYKDNGEAPYLSQSLDLIPNLNYIASIISITKDNPALINAANHGLTTGDTISIYGVLGMDEINRSNYTITVIDENYFTLDGVDSTTYSVYETGGQIFLRPFYKDKTWKRAYCGGIGYQHKIKITSSGNKEPYKIHAFKPYFRPIGRRTIN